MIYPIRLYGDPILRKVASPVTEFNDALATLAENMIETMYEANGVGLAAPQIGIAKRMFVALETKESEEEDDDEANTREQKKKQWGVVDEHVMINPEISLPDGQVLMQEGCLSLPGLYVEAVERPEHIHVKYQDVKGNWHERDVDGHFARVIQHENDHLDGVLFLDRLPKQEKLAFMDEHRQALAQMQRDAKAFLKDIKDAATPAVIQ